MSLTGDKWEKHPIVTSPEAPRILGIDCLKRRYFRDPKGYRWAFGIATVNTEKIKQLSTLPGLLKDPFIVGLLRVEEQQARECRSAARAILFADEVPVRKQRGIVPPETVGQDQTEWVVVERGSRSGSSLTDSVDSEGAAEIGVFPVETVPPRLDGPSLRQAWEVLRQDLLKELRECLLDWVPGGDVKGELYRQVKEWEERTTPEGELKKLRELKTVVAGEPPPGEGNQEPLPGEQAEFLPAEPMQVDPVAAEPVPVAAEPVPAQAAPVPVAAEPMPAVVGPLPVRAGPLPARAEPLPARAGPLPVVAEPLPARAGPTGPVLAAPLPAGPGPVVPILAAPSTAPSAAPGPERVNPSAGPFRNWRAVPAAIDSDYSDEERMDSAIRRSSRSAPQRQAREGQDTLQRHWRGVKKKKKKREREREREAFHWKVLENLKNAVSQCGIHLLIKPIAVILSWFMTPWVSG
ncbi:uncharacterized protein LOC142034092 [Buteo buteo]|uniref:uncharacterized protein LOC142034092 n=1 Tax=Buteo buteo TaxID=30397 RepID=UPI003EBF5175